MEPPALAQAGADGIQASEADLQSLHSWRFQDHSQIAATLDEFLGSKVSRGPTSNTGQSWQEDRWRRWSQERPSTPAARTCARPAHLAEVAACTPDVDSQTR